MALLYSTWFYIILAWFNFTLPDSTLLYHGSPSLYLTLLDSALLFHCSTSLYLTLHDYTIPLRNFIRLYITLPWLYFNPHYSIMALLHYTWIYITLPWLYMTQHYSNVAILNSILDSTWNYHCSTSLSLTLHFSASVYLTQLYSTMALPISSSWFYITLPSLYFSVLNSTLLCHCSTSLYLTQH